MEKQTFIQNNHETFIVGPQIIIENIIFRGQALSVTKIKNIRKQLSTFHTLEIMAVNIYKYQITQERSELNHQLIAAMCNEMTHFQDFQVRLYEYGGKPSKLRWMFWAVGIVFGFTSRLAGKNFILKLNVWAEAKAIAHYDKLLQTVDWDDDTRKLIEKDRADEYSHLARWKKILVVNRGRGRRKADN